MKKNDIFTLANFYIFSLALTLKAFLDEQETQIVEYDEALVRRLIERITVHDDHFTVEFKSGVEVEVQG